MSDLLLEPVSILCEEVGLPQMPPDERGVYRLVIDGQEIRVSALLNGRVVLLGVIGNATDLAEDRRESRQQLLSGCLTLQMVRFGKLGTEQALTLEPETGELVLWQSLEGPGVSIPMFLSAAESLLNELEFWKNWLAASS